VGQVARQPIAQIHHGVDGKMTGQPAGLGQARFKFEMPAGKRAADSDEE